MMIFSLVVLAIPPTLRPGIEFTSGTTTLLRFEQDVLASQLREVYASLNHEEARIQSTGDREFLIRTRDLEIPDGSFSDVAPRVQDDTAGPTFRRALGTVLLGDQEATGEFLVRKPFKGNICVFGDIAVRVPASTEVTVLELREDCGPGNSVYRVAIGAVDGYVKITDTHDFVPVSAELDAIDQGERTVIETALEHSFGEFEVLEFASVSPVVSKAAVRNAAVAVAVASLFIMGYIAFAFSSVPRPFRYATCAIIALVHDVVIVLGVFSLLGKILGIEINLMFVTGLLTVIGFSVHDSIVIFDRIRENVSLAPEAPLAENVNAALVQTLVRSVNTSLTLLFTVLALLLLGGVTIQSFLLVVMVGVIIGTYSSIGVAAQLLVAWEEGDFGRWFRRMSGRGGTEATPA